MADALLIPGSISLDRHRVEVDAKGADQQTLLFWYPVVTTASDGYVRSPVKIEAGATSPLDPNVVTRVPPYVSDALPDLDLTGDGITTVEAQRTFWDKVVIRNRLRRCYNLRGQLRHGGHRVSSHYYDIFRLLQSSVSQDARANQQLGIDCARQARVFFNRPDFDLDDAVAGTYSLSPSQHMRESLERDHDAMAAMLMGTAPSFEAILASIATFETTVNGRG